MISKNMAAVPIKIVTKMLHCPYNPQAIHLSSFMYISLHVAVMFNYHMQYKPYCSMLLFLSQNDTKPNARSICLQDKFLFKIREGQYWGINEKLLQVIKGFQLSLPPKNLTFFCVSA